MRRSIAATLMFALLAASACSRQDSVSEEHAAHDARAGRAEGMSEDRAMDHAGAGAAPSGSIKGMATVTIPAERRQAIGVRTETVTRRPLTHTIRTVGVVAADERRVRKVQTKISGWVQQLFVSFTGEHVDTGQPILSIYSPDLVAAQREYLLALQASRGGLASGAGAEDRRSLLEAARTRLRFWDLTGAQLEALERSGAPQRAVTLHSPISGYVTIKSVYAGMYVTPEMELYTVTELGAVWIWADVYESELALVQPGQQATITLASASGSTRSAVVRYVNPTMEPVTRTLRARFDVDNGDGQLKPGMYATVELQVPLGEVLAVPEDAIIDTGERKVTFVALDQDRFAPRELRLGRKGERYYEVLDGLADGDRVVVSAQFLLDSESRLRGAAGGPAHGGH